jgi:hypothetical protein
MVEGTLNLAAVEVDKKEGFSLSGEDKEDGGMVYQEDVRRSESWGAAAAAGHKRI